MSSESGKINSSCGSIVKCVLQDSPEGRRQQTFDVGLSRWTLLENALAALDLPYLGSTRCTYGNLRTFFNAIAVQGFLQGVEWGNSYCCSTWADGLKHSIDNLQGEIEPIF
jgi:hypothetical protein